MKKRRTDGVYLSLWNVVCFCCRRAKWNILFGLCLMYACWLNSVGIWFGIPGGSNRAEHILNIKLHLVSKRKRRFSGAEKWRAFSCTHALHDFILWRRYKLHSKSGTVNTFQYRNVKQLVHQQCVIIDKAPLLWTLFRQVKLHIQ